MPEYLAPGVFVEEVSFRQKSIEGVGTSVAGIVGPTRFGPVRGKPLLCTSYLDFERYFGDARNLVFGAAKAVAVNHTAYAARAFFDNGGKQLFVTRVVNGGGGQATGAALGTASFAANALAIGTGQAAATLTFRARFPGAAGNLDLVFTPRTAENLVTVAVPAEAKEGDAALVTAADVAQPRLVLAPGGLAAGIGLPLKSLSGTAALAVPDATKPTETQWSFTTDSRLLVVDKDGKTFNDTPAALGILGLKPDAADALGTVRFRNAAAAVAGGVYSIGLDARVEALLPADALAGRGALLVGTLSQDKASFALAKDPNGLAKDVTLPLTALARADTRDPAKVWRRDYAVTAELDGEALFEYGTVSPDPASPLFLPRAMPAKPQKLADDVVQPAAAALDGAAPAEAAVVAALEAAFEPSARRPVSPAIAARLVIRLAGGTDGDLPDAADFRGDQDEQRGSTGFAALEDVDEIAIVLAPFAAALDRKVYRAVIAEMQAHLRRMRYRIGVIDSQRNMTISEIRDFRADISDDRLALYYPWIRAGGLTAEWDEVQLPPSGYLAGIYAGTDVRRGVHKAPANEVVLGAIGLEANINQYQQELLNPLGINCLRFFPNRGYRVWGGRTLADDPDWKYVNVRRYFLFLEKSIERATAWAVFEPNGEDLWANIRATVDDFLYNEWFNRHLLGATTEQAYFVRCDRSTMTQNDLDNGRLVCLIGVAPLRPAEFVIFRIGQKTADAR
ncbi:phage tail sheath family protein [Paracraurococcus ruber]|uniref:Phage tail protein n=1 Tax=Paracraurococcus ruber TaxID=77675 RepID=A0ABS1CRV6_9PROT|nr:phage tail sheath subtilisin-like domain-containing protein [Paracraurococcus ruber]MBK1657103.1 hypothetical protein [Paracraurococcus ruber]TDG33402.1 phage tail protein [Paracraurococcus ruber]